MPKLLLGCGHKKWLPGNTSCEDLITLDNNPDCNPDILCNLNSFISYANHGWHIYTEVEKFPEILEEPTHLTYSGQYRRFKDSIFSEVHAYEVLEHLGRQGDAESFFATFDNIWRILLPNGYLFGTCPSRFGCWLWGDPGHARAILPESLIYLDQTSYKQCGFTTFSDYRSVYHSDFKIVSSVDDKITHSFVLQAIKPARIV
jgi:hypothetical protein